MTSLSLFLLATLALPAQAPQDTLAARLTTGPGSGTTPWRQLLPARPALPRYPGEALRLGFESAFLVRDALPPLDPAALEDLRASLGPERTAAFLRALAAAVPATVELEYRLVQQDAGGRQAELLAGREPVPVDQVVLLADQRLRRAVVDLDVEIAQGASIADPVVAVIADGAALAVDLRPLPDGSWLAEILVRAAAAGDGDEAIDLGYPAMDGLRRNPVDLAEAGWVARIPGGEATTWRLPARDGGVLILTLAPAPGPTPPADSPALFLPGLARPPVGFLAPPFLLDEEAVEAAGNREVPVRAGLEAVLGGEALGSVVSHEASGALLLAGERAPELASRLRRAALAAAASRTVELEVRQTGPKDGESKLLASFQGPLTVGTWTGFAAGRVQEAVDDWDVEVAQGARVADPAPCLVEEGARASLRLRADGRVDLDLDLLALEAIRRHPLVLADALAGRPEEGLPMLPAQRVHVEEPVLRRLRVAGTWSLSPSPAGPGGALRLVRSAAGLAGPGSRVVVDLRVH